MNNRGMGGLRKAAVAALFGAGVFIASTTAASAHQVYQRCDSDGDRCWNVLCDDDGDDCHRLQSDWSDRRYYYDQRYDYDRYYNDHYYDRYNSRRYVCDRDGDDCRWENTSPSWWDR